MCGIVYVHGKKPVHKKVLQRYTAQSGRGNEGFGFIAFTNQKVKTYKRFQTEKDMKTALSKVNDTHVLFHHRYPTSTENVAEASHPIKVSHDELEYDYYVTHNGVISNSYTLKPQHEKLGYVYSTVIKTQYVTANGNVYNGTTQFNDTESLAIELARNIELGTPIMACGSASFIVLKTTKGGKKALELIYGTNGGNPLTIDKSKYGLIIASQGGAVSVTAMIMYTLCLKTNVTQSNILDMSGYVTKSPAVGYGAYQPYAYSGYSRDDDDEWIDTTIPLAYSPKTSTKDLEYLLEEIEQDIKIARQSGESEELQDLLMEKIAIEESLLESYYA